MEVVNGKIFRKAGFWYFEEANTGRQFPVNEQHSIWLAVGRDENRSADARQEAGSNDVIVDRLC
jgi:hypothetical protein